MDNTDYRELIMAIRKNEIYEFLHYLTLCSGLDGKLSLLLKTRLYQMTPESDYG